MSAYSSAFSVLIYTEATPNPSSMKFVLNFELVSQGKSFEYISAEDSQEKTKKSPLAEELFQNFDSIERIFISYNFITITKKEGIEWESIVLTVKQFIKTYIEDKKPIFDLLHSEEYFMEDSEIVQKIKTILDQYVRPAVESDGGAINFHSFHEGVVKVTLQGSCSGCPSSTITLKSGIENLLTRMIPEVREVVAQGI